MEQKAFKKSTVATKESHLQLVPEESGHETNLLEASRSHKKGEDSEGVWLISYADMMTLLMGFFALIASISKIDNVQFDKVREQAVKHFGGEFENPYGDIAQKIRTIIKNAGLSEQVLVESKPEGITMLFQGSSTFESASVEPVSSMQPLLSEIAGVVKREAPDFSILIEGHTDDVPISKGLIQSNWELSALRSARIAHFFEAAEFKKAQITILGWGETKPLAPNENSDGSPNLANMSKNRRVTITLHR